MGVNWEIVKITGIGWLVISSVVFSIVYIVRVLEEKKWLHRWRLFHNESPENLERMLLSFDKAVFPKIATNEDGIISNVNPAAEKLLGWKEKELISKNITVIITVKDKYKVAEMLTSLKGQKMPLRDFYQAVVRKDGYEVESEIFFKKDEIREGFYVYIFLIRDRFKELKIIKQLHQLIDLLKVKLDILSKGEELGNTGSWVWDLSDQTLTVSEGYKKIIGADSKDGNKFPQQELRGRVWWEDEPKVKAALALAFKGEPYEITYRQIRAKDFKLVTIRSTVQPILGEDKVPIGFYGSTTKLAEENVKIQ